MWLAQSGSSSSVHYNTAKFGQICCPKTVTSGCLPHMSTNSADIDENKQPATAPFRHVMWLAQSGSSSSVYYNTAKFGQICCPKPVTSGCLPHMSTNSADIDENKQPATAPFRHVMWLAQS